LPIDFNPDSGYHQKDFSVSISFEGPAMDETSQKLAKVDYYVKLVLKRRWLLIIPFCISMLVGIYLAISLPKVYRSSSLIMVVPKTVPDKFVPSLQATDTQERINTIKQQILSRSNLEKIIEDFDLYVEPRYRNLYLEDKVRMVRERVGIDVTKFGRGVDSFRISFRGREPRKVAAVASALAGRFIDESIAVIMEEVLETNQFLDGELDDLRAQLKEIEMAIQSYRRENMGELPEELDSNLRILDRLQAQLSEKQEDLRGGRNRLTELDTRISGISIPESKAAPSDVGISQISQIEAPEAEPSKLEVARRQLQALEGRYTGRHPDIIRMKTMVAELEARERADRETADEVPTGDVEAGTGELVSPPSVAASPNAPNVSSPESAFFRKQLVDLEAQRQTTLNEIAQTLRDIKSIENQIKEYQAKVESASRHEMELLGLERNYDNLQNSYKSLLDRKLESDIAVNLEKKQKGQSFRVIDQAKVPQRPVSPDMKKLLLFCVAAGMGTGGGLIFLLDLLDRSIKIPQDAERHLGLPILATIPDRRFSKDHFRHRLNQAMSFVCLVFGLGLFCFLSIMSFRGVDATLDAARKLLS
jgi:polysaccharide chain length determinant protein (PEP-CTERM system associated)